MALKTGTFSDIVTWLVMTNNAVIFNNNRTIQKTFIFEGKDSYRMTDADQELYIDHINEAFKRLKSGFIVYLEAQKTKDMEYMDKSIENPLTAELDTIREKNLTGKNNYRMRYFLTFVYRQPSDFLQRFENVVDKDNKTVLKEVKQAVKDFINVFTIRANQQEMDNEMMKNGEFMAKAEADFLDNVEEIVSLLNRHFSNIRPLTTEETLTYLHSTISDSQHAIKANYRAYIVQNLSDSPLITGRQPKLGNKYIGTVGIKDLPATCHAFMFDKLNSLKSEFRWSTRWIALSKEDAKKENLKIQQQHRQRAKTPFTMLYEALQNKDSGKVDPAALRDEEEAQDLLMEQEQDLISLGYLTTNIVLMNEDPDVLNLELKELKTIVNDMGFIATVEKDNATSAWLSTIPSVYELNVRRFLVHSLTFAACAPLSARWEGQKKNEHFEKLGLQSMPLLKCQTPEQFPFYLNLHVDEVGHTFIAGVTGTGKSVLLNAITCNFLKYKDAKIFIFDKSASSRVLTQAMGGNFYNLLVDDSIAFQPLANIDDANELIWVFEWLKRYASSRNVEITTDEESLLLTALKSLAGTPKHLRTITLLSTSVQSELWRSILSSLIGSDGSGGTYGRLFDNDEDKFGHGNWQAFEMEKIMENESILAPTLDYLFHRIESQLSKVPALIIMDECWLFLRNDAFRKKIAEYIKDLRKKNAAVIMATQNLSDITDDLKPVISENMLTKIFLANEGMTPLSEKLYREFGLNDRELEIVKSLKSRKEYYYKSQLGSRVFDLNLSPVELAFIASTNRIDQQKAGLLADLKPAEFIREWKKVKGVS